MITSFKLFESEMAYEQVPTTFNAVQPMSEEELLAFISEHCKSFSLENTPLYRGVRFKGAPYSIAQPSQKERKSRPLDNTGNHYTLLVDNLDCWAGWPKRSKSLCLATKDTRTQIYTRDGEGMVYRVIPLDGANVAVCSTKDFWFSFQYLARFADGIDLPTLSRRLQYDYAIKDSSWPAMVDSMDSWSAKLKVTCPNTPAALKNKPASYAFVHEIVKGDWRARLNKLMDPVKNGFAMKHYVKGFNVPGYNKEVWTESDCVMIEVSEFDRLVKEGKIK